MDTIQFLNLIKSVGPWGALILVVYIFHKAGLLQVLVQLISRLTKLQDNQRLNTLEDFKKRAELNHFHDIEELKGKCDEMAQSLNDFKLQVEHRFTRLESKVFNGFGKMRDGQN